jgi:hypothetical protein
LEHFLEELRFTTGCMHITGKDCVVEKEKLFQKFKKIWNLKN